MLKREIPGLNGKNGLIRENYFAAKRRKLAIQVEIMGQTRHQHPGAVRVEFTRYSTWLFDWDNHCASFKHIGDALTKTKVIIDDNPFVIRKFIPRQVKIKSQKETCCVVTITDYHEKEIDPAVNRDQP